MLLFLPAFKPKQRTYTVLYKHKFENGREARFVISSNKIFYWFIINILEEWKLIRLNWTRFNVYCHQITRMKKIFFFTVLTILWNSRTHQKQLPWLNVYSPMRLLLNSSLYIYVITIHIRVLCWFLLVKQPLGKNNYDACKASRGGGYVLWKIRVFLIHYISQLHVFHKTLELSRSWEKCLGTNCYRTQAYLN